jgi:hypothetical protein
VTPKRTEMVSALALLALYVVGTEKRCLMAAVSLQSATSLDAQQEQAVIMQDEGHPGELLLEQRPLTAAKARVAVTRPGRCLARTIQTCLKEVTVGPLLE